MKRRWIAALKRHEIYVVSTVIGVVFAAAMGIVAWMLQSSIVTQPYETMGPKELGSIFATGYLRFREDDKSPYLKVELHNGTMWWIKRIEFDFDGMTHVLRESDAFRPMHFGAVRCSLKKVPNPSEQIEYDLKIVKASGYPPAHVRLDHASQKIAGESRNYRPDSY